MALALAAPGGVRALPARSRVLPVVHSAAGRPLAQRSVRRRGHGRGASVCASAQKQRMRQQVAVSEAGAAAAPSGDTDEDADEKGASNSAERTAAHAPAAGAASAGDDAAGVGVEAAAGNDSASEAARQLPGLLAACAVSLCVALAVRVGAGESLAVVGDCLATVGGGAGALALVRIFEALAVSGTLEQKLSRKLVHMASGPLFVLTWPLFSGTPDARLFAAAVPALNTLRLLGVGMGVIEGSGTVKAVSRSGSRQEVLRGPLYYVLILVAMTLCFWRTSPVGVVALSMMCGGDGLADIVGRRLGSAKLPFNERKSWAGSIAMFAGGWATAVALISVLCATSGDFAMSSADWAALPVIALACTVVEALPMEELAQDLAVADDNITVPVTAALLGTVLLGTF